MDEHVMHDVKYNQNASMMRFVTNGVLYAFYSIRKENRLL